MGHAANAETKIENLRNSPQLVKSLEVAFQLAPGLGHNEIQPAHLALALFEDPDVLFLINAYGVDMELTKSNILKQLPPVTKASSQNAQLSRNCAYIIEHAAQSASSSAQEELDSTMVFAALLSDKESQLAKLLNEEDLTVESVEEYIELRSGQGFKMPVLPPMPPMPKQAPAKTKAQAPTTPQAAPSPEPSQKPSIDTKKPDSVPSKPAPAAPVVSSPVTAQPVTASQPTPKPVAVAKTAKRVPPAAAEPQPATPAKPIATKPAKVSPSTQQAAPPKPAPVQNRPTPAPVSPAPAPAQAQAVSNAQPAQVTMGKDEAQSRAQSILQSSNASSSDHLTQKITQATKPIPAAAIVENVKPHRKSQSEETGTLSATRSVIEKGRLNVDFPGSMRVGESEIVKINLQRNKDEAEDPLQDPVITEALTVQLKAPAGNFHIEPLRPETNWLDPKTRYIGDGAYGNWKWKVRPLKSGQTQLNLVVSARTLDESGLLSEAVLPDQTINIRVQANLMRWVYIAAIGLFAIGAIALLTQFYPLIRTFF